MFRCPSLAAALTIPYLPEARGAVNSDHGSGLYLPGC